MYWELILGLKIYQIFISLVELKLFNNNLMQYYRVKSSYI